MDFRQDVLRRVRDGLRDLPDDHRHVTVRTGAAARGPVLDPAQRAELADRFAEQLRGHDTPVWQTSADDLPEAVCAALDALGVRTACTADPSPPWLDLWSAGEDRAVVFEGRDDSDDAEVVVGEAVAAVASSGALAVETGAGRHRLGIAPRLCVVRAERLHPSLPEALEAVDPRRPLVWLGGPDESTAAGLSAVVLVS
ncbi:hypothetical protein ACWEVD_08050 [Nocardia thailandica]